MSALLERLGSTQITDLIIIFGGFIFATIMVLSIVITINWRKVKERELAASIVDSLLASGHTVEDVERVLKATGLRTPHPLEHVGDTVCRVQARWQSHRDKRESSSVS
jgi:hypothetical protein